MPSASFGLETPISGHLMLAVWPESLRISGGYDPEVTWHLTPGIQHWALYTLPTFISDGLKPIRRLHPFKLLARKATRFGKKSGVKLFKPTVVVPIATPSGGVPMLGAQFLRFLQRNKQKTHTPSKDVCSAKGQPSKQPWPLKGVRAKCEQSRKPIDICSYPHGYKS